MELFRIPEGKSDHAFEVNGAFLKALDQHILEQAQGEVMLQLDRTSTMMTLRFSFNVEVGLVCDRSLRPYSFVIDANESIYMKFGEEFEEQDVNLFIIPRDAEFIDIGKLIFDIVATQLPVKRIHPDLETDEAAEGYDQLGNPKVYTTEKETEIKKPSKDEPDPRWSALMALKKKEDGAS